MKIPASSIDTLGLGHSTLAITNHSSKQSDYVATVAFENAAGTQIGTGAGPLNSVDAGQTPSDTASGGLTGSTAGMKFALKQVDRTSSVR